MKYGVPNYCEILMHQHAQGDDVSNVSKGSEKAENHILNQGATKTVYSNDHAPV